VWSEGIRLRTCFVDRLWQLGRVRPSGTIGSPLFRDNPLGKLPCHDRPQPGSGLSFYVVEPHQPGDQTGRTGPIQLPLVCAGSRAVVVEGIERGRWQFGECRQRARPGYGLSQPESRGGRPPHRAPAPEPGMDGKSARELCARVQAGLCDLLLSWGKPIPGSLCLRLRYGRNPRPAGLRFTFGSGANASEILNYFFCTYVNF
jgi:hypothetical protein